MTAASPGGQRLPIASWLVPLLAGAAAYAIAPAGDLVWDDETIRQQLAAFPGLASIFQPPPGIPNWTYLFYRPVTLLSYMVDLAVFGPDTAAGAHLANVAYHLAAVFCVWRLALRLLARRTDAAAGAMVAATLFAVHPVHAESVSWISGRSDVLATVLLVPALLLALRWRDHGGAGTLLLSSLLFLLALLGKEVAIAGLAVLPVLLATAPALAAERGAADGGRPPAAMLLPLAAWVAAAAGYFLLRPGGAFDATLSAATALPPADVALQLVRATAWYVQKLVVPWPHSNFVPPEMLPSATAALAVLAAAACALLAAARHWWRLGHADVLTGLAWTALCIAPSLAVAMPGVLETPVAERYLYLPSVGAAVSLGALYCQLVGSSRALAARAVTAVLAALWLAATLHRGSVWLTDARLWADTTARVTAYGLPWIELGEARLAAGDEDGALQLFQRARDAKMTRAVQVLLEYKLGDLHWRRGERAAAIGAYTAAVDADPQAAMPHQVLGSALLQMHLLTSAGAPAASRLGSITRAISELEQAVARDPALAAAHLGLATACLARGDILREQQRDTEALASYQAAQAHLDSVRELDALLASSPEAGRLRAQLRARLPGSAP